MSSSKKVQVSRLAPVNISAQVTATHNSTFPFSSPMIDDHSSLKSIRTGHTALSKNPFESPGSSTTTLTDYESGATSEQDAWHLERYSETSKNDDHLNPSVVKLPRRTEARSAGLQIITDFSKPSYHANNLIIDHVQTRQAQTRANLARSIISQKGVKMEFVQRTKSKRSSGLLNVKGVLKNKKQKRRSIAPQVTERSDAIQPVGRAGSQKSIVIGLSLPQDEANFMRQNGELESAVTLNTPLTPAIILTPPDERLESSLQTESMPESRFGRRRPASSVYSTITCSREYDGEDDDEVPPLPSLPFFAKVNNLNTVSHIQANKQSASTHEIGSRDQISPNSAEHVPASCDTPQSQGWWNLLLSPMLSRTGSFASRRGYEADYSPPPVPEIPNEFEKNLAVGTPHTNPSPETPRRLGLACTPTAPWSNWTEWQQRLNSLDDNVHSKDVDLTNNTTEELPGKEFPAKLTYPDLNKGFAAEYYHACAIEQLTGAEYFECQNHSCQDHQPKLGTTEIVRHEQGRSIPGGMESPSQPKKLVVLGSPFKGNTICHPAVGVIPHQNVDMETASVTDIESDDESLLSCKQSRALPMKHNDDLYTPHESESEPDELSPNVRKADTAAFIKAKARGIDEATKPSTLPTQGQSLKQMPNIAASIGEKSTPEQYATTVSKTANQAKSAPALSIKSLDKPVPALPVKEGYKTPPVPEAEFQRQVQPKPQLLSQQFFMNPKGGFSGLPASPAAFKSQSHRKGSVATTHRTGSLDIEKREILHVEKGHSKPQREYCLHIKSIFRPRNDKSKTERKRRRRCVICICLLLLIIVIVCIILAITITRRGDGTPVASRWLNLTGYPPMPVGISTIAQPALAQSQTGCVQPATLWSCALPKDDQERTASNGSSVPDFRFEIMYRNGTTPASMNIPLTKRANDPFTNDLFTANPAPPNDADQLFLGNTTDNITAPFDGEPTPFYITFMSTFPIVPSSFNSSTQKLSKRQANLGINIPAPNTLADGSAPPAALLPTDPFPTSQPVQLYNRGREDEHYGFYIYFDKSVFLSEITISGGNASTSNTTGTSADEDGGSTKDDANIRCTWQQTRFLVKIFTNTKFGGSIFPGRQNVSLDTSEKSEYSSATDFTQPGSFPYPTSVIIDRHGGNINNKITYCYAMDKGKILQDEKVLVFEDRSAGGTLINGAPSFVNADGNSTDTSSNGSFNGSFDSAAGGIDGGTGGCSCTWQNWQ